MPLRKISPLSIPTNARISCFGSNTECNKSVFGRIALQVHRRSWLLRVTSGRGLPFEHSSALPESPPPNDVPHRIIAGSQNK